LDFVQCALDCEFEMRNFQLTDEITLSKQPRRTSHRRNHLWIFSFSGQGRRCGDQTPPQKDLAYARDLAEKTFKRSVQRGRSNSRQREQECHYPHGNRDRSSPQRKAIISFA
jgi:hypothetical protein